MMHHEVSAGDPAGAIRGEVPERDPLIQTCATTAHWTHSTIQGSLPRKR